jgi:hypothetical protein
MYDTQTFLKVYCALVTQVVVRQRARNVPATCIAAHAALSRELTDFLERELQVAVSTAFSVVGSVVLLACNDPLVSGLACALGVGGLVLNSSFGRTSTALSRESHDVCEREVDFISQGTAAVTQAHYHHVARREIRMSDGQAAAFSDTQAIVLALLVVSMLRSAGWGRQSVGDVRRVSLRDDVHDGAGLAARNDSPRFAPARYSATAEDIHNHTVTEQRVVVSNVALIRQTVCPGLGASPIQVAFPGRRGIACLCGGLSPWNAERRAVLRAFCQSQAGAPNTALGKTYVKYTPQDSNSDQFVREVPQFCGQAVQNPVQLAHQPVNMTPHCRPSLRRGLGCEVRPRLRYWPWCRRLSG